MSVELHPTFRGGTARIKDVMNFRHSPLPTEFMQESAVPFSVTLTTCRNDDPENDTYSVFVPNGQFNGSVHHTIKGRTERDLHSHNYFELTYILEGNLYQLVEGNEYLYPVGSCCLLNRNTKHTELFNSSYRALFLTITPEMVQAMNHFQKNLIFMENRQRNPLIQDFLNRNLQSSHDDSKDFLDFVPRIEENIQKTLIHDIFERMIQTMISPVHGATYDIYKFLDQLFEILCDDLYYQGVYVSPDTRTDSLLFARINHILSECDGRITNRELSQLLSYNGTYLGRIVKKNTGLSLFQYSMTFTMKAAARYLTTTSMSVYKIMEQLRFTNQTHFYQLFKNHYGMSPTEYRILHKVQNHL